MLVGLIGITFLVKFNNIFKFFSSINNTQNGDIAILLIWILLAIILGFLVILLFRESLQKLSIYKKIESFLIGLKDGITSLSNVKNKLAFWGHTFFIWTMYILMTYVCFFCIPETYHLSITDGLYSNSSISVRQNIKGKDNSK